MENMLYFGDNLDILREYIPDESVDLIYLDPPFNSQAQYNVLFRSPAEDAAAAQVEAFRDMWMWGEEAENTFAEIMKFGGGTARLIDALRSALRESDMMAYLVMMALRLHELSTKLKQGGSLYIHCDPNASHYLKILLDGIFEPTNFRNEVIWKRTSAHNSAKRYGPSHDTILFYTKGRKFTWNPQFGAYDQQYIDAFFTHVDERGRQWQRTDMTGPGTRQGDSGKPWRDYNPTDRGRHWQPPSYFYDKYEAITGEKLAHYDLIDRLNKLDELGLIHWPQKKGGMPRGKRFLEDAPGVPLQDVWTDIRAIHNMSSERTGYPTQKPLSLLERIIAASSNEGDVVLDPFCGCGTTIEAAERGNRHWIGIDIAVHAIKVIEARMAERTNRNEIRVEGIPRDFLSAERLARDDKYQFQWWANYLFNPHALREQKKGADRGIDGELFFPNGPGRPWGRMLMSVKGGANIGPAMVRDLRGVLQGEDAEMGLFICLYKPTKAMLIEAATAGIADTVHEGIPKLQIISIEEWFEGKGPKLPPMEHLPSAAFAGRARMAPKKAKKPDPTQPELPLSYLGGKGKDKDTIVHLNPTMVRGAIKEIA